MNILRMKGSIGKTVILMRCFGPFDVVLSWSWKRLNFRHWGSHWLRFASNSGGDSDSVHELNMMPPNDAINERAEAGSEDSDLPDPMGHIRKQLSLQTH